MASELMFGGNPAVQVLGSFRIQKHTRVYPRIYRELVPSKFSFTGHSGFRETSRPEKTSRLEDGMFILAISRHTEPFFDFRFRRQASMDVQCHKITPYYVAGMSHKYPI